MFQTTLKAIKQVLETDGMKCQLMPKTEEIPFDQLYVALMVEGIPQEVILQLKMVEHALEDVSQREKGTLHLLQFFVGLPFKVHEEKIDETIRFLCLINRSFEIPGFEFSEVDRVVYYRYVLMTSENSIPSILIKNLLGVIMFILDGFSTKIEDIAKGKRSLDEIIQEAIQENEEPE
jgi:hypothetical protein